jgi:SAM-dependent methyltransferase
MPSSQYSHEELSTFWLKVVDPAGIGPARAIASELAAYTGESIDDVLRKMNTGGDDFNDLWHRATVNTTDERSVASFYRDQFVEAYELANWHCGLTYGSFPLNYAKAALYARRLRLARALDFGSGIGTGSIALSLAGCEVHSADVANQLLRFVDHRLRHRNIQPRLIDLGAGDRPPTGYFDLITCFDVLEHVPNQLLKVRELITYLRPGGYIFVNFYKDPIGADHAMHISGAGDWLHLARRTPLVPVWECFDGELQVLRQKPFGRVYNFAASFKDKAQGFIMVVRRERK